MRTFVAVEVSDEAVIESISKFQSRINVNARPVKPHNLHFTLQFLGEVSAGAAEKVREALKTVEFSSFVVGFRGVGAFPGPKFPRVIWVGTDGDGDGGGGGGSQELRELARKVGEVLAPLGFSGGRPFVPHITVLRAKKKIGDVSGELEKYESAGFGTQQVSVMKFKQSVLTPDGPVYSDLGEVRAVQ